MRILEGDLILGGSAEKSKQPRRKASSLMQSKQSLVVAEKFYSMLAQLA